MNKGVVRWHGITGDSGIGRNGHVRIGREAAGLLIDIDPDDGGKEVFRNPLAVVELVILAALVTERNIEIAVRTEAKARALVIRGLVPLLDEDQLGGGIRGIATAGEA